MGACCHVGRTSAAHMTCCCGASLEGADMHQFDERRRHDADAQPGSGLRELLATTEEMPHNSVGFKSRKCIIKFAYHFRHAARHACGDSVWIYGVLNDLYTTASPLPGSQVTVFLGQLVPRCAIIGGAPRRVAVNHEDDEGFERTPTRTLGRYQLRQNVSRNAAQNSVHLSRPPVAIKHDVHASIHCWPDDPFDSVKVRRNVSGLERRGCDLTNTNCVGVMMELVYEGAECSRFISGKGA